MWKKKLREYKGRFKNYSLREKLNKENKINSNFETILNSLTMEDIIALKLELSASHVNYKLFGFPIMRAMKNIVKESCVRFALSACKTTRDAATMLGVTELKLYEEINRFQINPDDCNYELSEDTI